jgi:glycosyltransferase involved in cell wall biosynthesis
VTGLVADPSEFDRWVEKLVALRVDDDRAGRLQKNARVWVEDNFDVDKNTARLARLYEAAINAHAGHGN